MNGFTRSLVVIALSGVQAAFALDPWRHVTRAARPFERPGQEKGYKGATRADCQRRFPDAWQTEPTFRRPNDSESVLEAGGSPGHFGLVGMRERAKKLGGHLEIWSKPEAGTETDLRIPANMVYVHLGRSSRMRWMFAIFRRRVHPL